ncbi:MAG TPA: 3-phosphoshikimate 1-carboxyvinyltransferase [Clostridium sp.]|jgi:3-phosphoshikimate 1-carboxyvinyltransferase|nr:3-phosphoshikimate 1-carboxyvinyltransferase [Clostridia bacterium]HCW03273.1 3-phosphoshikimate 1-carboxyvinyltransferase [Clostridium sp.]
MTYIEVKNSSTLQGKVNIPSSKSVGHRALICAALAEGTSIIRNINLSKDIKATAGVLEALGAAIKIDEREINVKGTNKLKYSASELFCNESGSTLRFLIPVAMLQEDTVTFTGRGKLVERPLTPFYNIFDKQRLYYKNNNGMLPLEVKGRLKAGDFSIEGNVSSQFISGLMFALPLLNENSKIIVDGKLESRPYIDLTIDVLREFGVNIDNNNYESFTIKGGQKYTAKDYTVEGDYSQAAFFLAAGLLNGKVQCMNLKKDSLQGDKEFINIATRMGGKIIEEDHGFIAIKSDLTATDIDASQVPDLVPILAVLASVSQGQTVIYNAARLRIKECDRLQAVTTELNALGANIIEKEDSLIINGVKSLKGGKVKSWNDHRIAMSMTIASLVCENPVIIEDYKAIDKSYPDFYEDFISLGGHISF